MTWELVWATRYSSPALWHLVRLQWRPGAFGGAPFLGLPHAHYEETLCKVRTFSSTAFGDGAVAVRRRGRPKKGLCSDCVALDADQAALAEAVLVAGGAG